MAIAGGRTRRATRACDNCRRLKEKCNGGTPCDRCNKSGRQCLFTNTFRRTRNPRPAGEQLHSRASPVVDSVDPNKFFEVERIRLLETIVQHFTGIDRCTKSNLQEVVATLQSEGSPSPSHTPKSAGLDEHNTIEDFAVESQGQPTLPVYEQFSHSDFSRRVQQTMETQSEGHQQGTASGVVPAKQLLSQDYLVQEAASLFPLPDVAILLLDVFFNFAQTNYFYVDEDTLRHQLSEFYRPSRLLTITEAPWVCTALMVFAVGTQFAHLAPSPRTRVDGDVITMSSAMDDTLALAFYRKAATLIPDVLTIGSLQSVQAFGLLGIYALPLDPAGLSCTYFGIAVKLATHNGMHKKSYNSFTTRDVEVRNRIWWTVYTLERRISILHGRPASTSRCDVDVALPVDLVDLQPRERIDTFQNVMAQRGITELMEDARDAILALKKADRAKFPVMAQNLLIVKQHLQTWWNTLPKETYCRDLSPGKPLFRSNIHIALTYHLVHIFIGRSFIFDEADPNPEALTAYEWKIVRDDLIGDCVKSAAASIELCQVLQDDFGLSKSSYTEFTSCCAAVFALVARQIFTKDQVLKDLCNQGLTLLKIMSSGVFAKSCERRGLDILEMALHKLDGSHQQPSLLRGTGYTEFRNWVAMQQVVPGEALRQDQALLPDDWASGNVSNPGVAAPQGKMSNASEFLSSTLADLSSLPELEEWLQHSVA
ncbi:fungal-specific transcription factor domain-containing protein [Ilyonectria sp. MPI-CAGE-AT-0026]|nr:fungal-specific transcription factor domain-containing protein [Ilyonectria sp. MPI-CAGE-AT-0026]